MGVLINFENCVLLGPMHAMDDNIIVCLNYAIHALVQKLSVSATLLIPPLCVRSVPRISVKILSGPVRSIPSFSKPRVNVLIIYPALYS